MTTSTGQPKLADLSCYKVHDDGINHIGLWSGKQPLPAIGTPINVTMNGLGHGIIQGYFFEAGYIGLQVKLTNPPEWFLEQRKNRPNTLAYVYGTECTLG